MALITPGYLNWSVAISKNIDTENIIVWTGFLFGKKDKKTNLYDIYLVTNRHVIEKNKWDLNFYIKKWDHNFSCWWVKTHTKNADWVENPLFRFHSNPTIDIAITHILNPGEIINKENLSFFYESDNHTYNQEDMIDAGISEWDGIFVIWFPASITWKSTTPVVRKWIIARIQDYYEWREPKFLIDAFIFPGNSWWPVVIKPEIHNVVDTKVNDKSRLIWIVSAYMPYHETLISTQTGKLCQKIEHNSWLTIVEPIDSLLELITEYENTIKE